MKSILKLFFLSIYGGIFVSSFVYFITCILANFIYAEEYLKVRDVNIELFNNISKVTLIATLITFITVSIISFYTTKKNDVEIISDESKKYFTWMMIAISILTFVIPSGLGFILTFQWLIFGLFYLTLLRKRYIETGEKSIVTFCLFIFIIWIIALLSMAFNLFSSL